MEPTERDLQKFAEALKKEVWIEPSKGDLEEARRKLAQAVARSSRELHASRKKSELLKGLDFLKPAK